MKEHGQVVRPPTHLESTDGPAAYWFVPQYGSATSGTSTYSITTASWNYLFFQNGLVQAMMRKATGSVAIIGGGEEVPANFRFSLKSRIRHSLKNLTNAKFSITVFTCKLKEDIAAIEDTIPSQIWDGKNIASLLAMGWAQSGWILPLQEPTGTLMNPLVAQQEASWKDSVTWTAYVKVLRARTYNLQPGFEKIITLKSHKMIQLAQWARPVTTATTVTDLEPHIYHRRGAKFILIKINAPIASHTEVANTLTTGDAKLGVYTQVRLEGRSLHNAAARRKIYVDTPLTFSDNLGLVQAQVATYPAVATGIYNVQSA